jgi:uncharacterized cupin superfamily protein
VRKGRKMEVQPGVFVSKASTDDWQTDPDVAGSQMHELVHADGVRAGVSRYTNVDGPITWTPERREVGVVLEGALQVEMAGGDPFELGVGDMFSLPSGVETTFHITTPFKEMWFAAQD